LLLALPSLRCCFGAFSHDIAPQQIVGHLHMNITKLSSIFLMLLLAACVKPPVITPASQAEADKAIDHTRARELSDSIAQNLLKDDRVSLRSQLEGRAREAYDEKSFGSIIDQMFAMYGKPLQADFKTDDLGRKTGTEGYDKPVRKFWYALRTEKHQIGTVFLTVEIVPDDHGLASSGVQMLTFPLGAPPWLK
jgi:hypothetical protein